MNVQSTLDPDAQALLDAARAMPRKSFDEMTLEEARAGFAKMRAATSPDPAPVAEVRDLNVPGPAGAIPVRLYRAAGSDPAARLPGVLFFHGGGWVLGDLDTHDPTCRQIANAAGCVVVAVHYRRPPEHAFPAAADDAYAALTWFANEASALGVDPDRIAVMGDSAGGNLAAVVALEARERGGPRLRAQILVYPVVDMRFDRDSFVRLGENYTLTRSGMEWFRTQYVPNEAHWDDWRAAPIRAEHLRDLPPALVFTAGHDPLSDEGAAYAERLRAEGVEAEHRHYPGQMHGFLGSGRVIRAAHQAIDEVAAALRKHWR